ncbi:MAG: hypothetical protein GF417_00475 [Candidatus Latescibacteria bacterium]|nr:hypothetical protein [bacterium]MBD3422902.1 hypothetical protein [Candidatus Latescibacterota bacterium]
MRRYIITFTLLITLAGARAKAQEPLIEAENFTDFHDIKGEPIESNVLEGKGFLSGLDAPGEWTSYRFNSETAGTRRVSLKLQGAEDVLFLLEISITDPEGGESQTVSFEYTGAGFS